MKVNAKSYPHPVLGNEDDLAGTFDVDFRYELAKEEVILTPHFSLKNEAIEEQIRNGSAAFMLEVQCRNTFFRRSYSTRKIIEHFSVPAKLLREQVTVEFFICAEKNIPGYKPSGCHPDYDGATFDIEQGDVLAAGGACSFIAEKSFDPLRPPISSFMSITDGTAFEGPMQVGYDTDKITIYLSKTDWNTYFAVRGNKHAEGILHSSIVLPVLVDAIYQVQIHGEEYEASNWCARLQAILDAKGLRKKEPMEAAQKILENPASRGFTGISGLLEMTDSEEYE